MNNSLRCLRWNVEEVAVTRHGTAFPTAGFRRWSNVHQHAKDMPNYSDIVIGHEEPCTRRTSTLSANTETSLEPEHVPIKPSTSSKPTIEQIPSQDLEFCSYLSFINAPVFSSPPSIEEHLTTGLHYYITCAFFPARFLAVLAWEQNGPVILKSTQLNRLGSCLVSSLEQLRSPTHCTASETFLRRTRPAKSGFKIATHSKCHEIQYQKNAVFRGHLFILIKKNGYLTSTWTDTK